MKWTVHIAFSYHKYVQLQKHITYSIVVQRYESFDIILYEKKRKNQSAKCSSLSFSLYIHVCVVPRP